MKSTDIGDKKLMFNQNKTELRRLLIKQRRSIATREYQEKAIAFVKTYKKIPYLNKQKLFYPISVFAKNPI